MLPYPARAIATPATKSEGRGPLRRLIDANLRISQRIGRRFESSTRFYREFDARVAEAARTLPSGSLIVDLGGGRSCRFADAVDREGGTRIVAVDVSEEELAANRDVEETRVADVAAGLPFEDGEVDLLVSRTLLEHVDGVPAAIEHVSRVVRPGARTLHLVPLRWSLFALGARILPFGFARRLTHLLFPTSEGVIEFETRYDHCEPAALEALFARAGFSSVEVEVSWAQAEYFRVFFPVYALVGLYQSLLRRLGIRRLAAYAAIEAVR